MMNTKINVCLFSFLVCIGSFAFERQPLWPKDKMPDSSGKQIAAMTAESEQSGFKADKHRIPYIEWYESPADSVRTGACMILISGGSYMHCCDGWLVDNWHEWLTYAGIQCVNLVYRTPRPEGLPYYKTAWEDGQRAVRLVRKEAEKRGFDPEKIGVISMSAGSHLGLLLATSSQTPAYDPIDRNDDVSCHINWGILNAPAYLTSDSILWGSPAEYDGYGPGVGLDPIFKFDEKTCPLCLTHGGNDPYSPNGSTKVYCKLHEMGVPAELHIYPDQGHGAFGFDRAMEFLKQMGFLGSTEYWDKLMDRYPDDNARGSVEKQQIWPEGKTPDFRDSQCEPYIEWHTPKVLKTKAIQIIYSGGSYVENDPDGFEVAPARRYLNEKGMTVVTLKYRTPRPEGLPKHITAWQDLQRTIRFVRSQALERGLDPDCIGIMGSSAGGHLTLMGVTSSCQHSYLGIDEVDKFPCNVQWGIGIYPAYALSDGTDDWNSSKGTAEDAVLVPEFNFDIMTSPMLFIHGDADGWSAMNSVKIWEKMRAMGIQSELHTLALRDHCFQMVATPGTGSYNFLDRIWDFLKEKAFVKQ